MLRHDQLSAAGNQSSLGRFNAVAGCMQADSTGSLTAASDRGQRIGLVVLDLEQLRQFRNGEDFINLRANVRQHQFRSMLLDPLVESNELAKGGTRQELDVAKIEDDFLPAFPL